MFAGGCFWCTEADFEKLDGVSEAISGYAGGDEVDPTYQQVAGGQTGHTEVVKVLYDPEVVSYENLLAWFWKHIDPTDPDGQFIDQGSQYRSAIFTTSEEQLAAAEAYIAALSQTGRYVNHPITTEVRPAPPFHAAEAYHQDYNERHGRSCGI